MDQPEWHSADCEEYPYRKFVANDVIRHVVYQDAVRDHLTYFNVLPRLYKSTDIISPVDYAHPPTSAFWRKISMRITV